MARKTIKGLEELLAQYQEWLAFSEKRNHELVEKAEIEFANSVTKKQLEERLDLEEKLRKSAKHHNELERKWRYRSSDAVRKVYEDNKAFMAGWDEAEYEIGITKRYDSKYLYKENQELTEQNQELRGMVDGQNLAIRRRDEIISNYLDEIVSLKSQIEVLKKTYESGLPAMDTAAAKLSQYREENCALLEEVHVLRMEKSEPVQRAESYSALETELRIAKEHLLNANEVINELQEAIALLKDKMNNVAF